MITSKLDYKIAYLTRLIKLYVLFTRKWKSVDVTIEDGGLYAPLQYQYVSGVTTPKKEKCIRVRYYNATKEWEKLGRLGNQFEVIEFPISHLSRRIISYKQKVRYEFQNRHKNTLLWEKLRNPKEV